MNKMMMRLAAACMSLLLAVTVTVVASYAWMTLSGSPAVQGLQVTIAGGNTILLAADLTVEEDGVTYHYPGAFSDTLNFTQHENYDYLSQLGGLTPVSTADGVTWFLPAYYQQDDAQVISGEVQLGELKAIDQFIQENDLQHANLTSTQADDMEQGSYIYLDFWVVAPAADYQLRISTNDDGNGSFLIGLPEPQEVDTNGDGVADSVQLADTAGSAAASARLGFLADESTVSNEALLKYLGSEDYNSQYISLRGVYSEQGESENTEEQRFTIYEPNGTLHSDPAIAEDGSYVVTTPLALTESGAVGLADLSDRLTVQKASQWLTTADGSQTILEQMFQVSMAGKNFRDMTQEELNSNFYQDYLQGQVSPYVDPGDFFKSTRNLYAYAQQNVVSAQTVSEQLTGSSYLAGATDDVYIVELERNIPQRIRMFIWIEGQDVDCTNDARASAFAIDLELAGSTIEK